MKYRSGYNIILHKFQQLAALMTSIYDSPPEDFEIMVQLFYVTEIRSHFRSSIDHCDEDVITRCT